MHLSIKCRDFCNFGANYIHAELLKSVCFVFCVIIMVIPSVLCFSSFLTISYRFPWCFRMSPLVFLRFPRVFLLIPPIPILDFAHLKHDVNHLHIIGTGVQPEIFQGREGSAELGQFDKNFC